MIVEDNVATECCTSGYDVAEYTELDFEHVVLETPEEIGDVCTSCHAWHTLPQSGIWTCTQCSSINHKDIAL